MSSLPFSRLICAKRRSRSPRFDTSPCTPVPFFLTSVTAVANSGSRRPVMKTYAPSFTNCCAVARPMPLLPRVMRAIFPSSLAMYSSRSLVLEDLRLAPRLGHCHDLQQVAVRVLEVEAAPVFRREFRHCPPTLAFLALRHRRLRAAVELLARHVLDVRGDVPRVAKRVLERAQPVAVEL